MTTWLTKITLDPRSRYARNDLTNVVRLHKRLMTLVPDDLGEAARSTVGMLYRVDETRTDTQILVQTQVPPDPARLPKSYGRVDMRDIEPLLDALEVGLPVRYRLAANASKRLGRKADHPGKVVALRGADADDWWIRQSFQHGLTLRSFTTSSEGYARGKAKESKNTARITHAVTRFDGLAIVTDPDKVRVAVRSGIGRGKAYGCGLLSVALAR